jgi:hypothetical protein
MRKRGLILATTGLLLSPAVTSDVHAQNGFMFGQPKTQLSLRVGPVLHRASGDVFELFRTDLTLERGDFRAPSVGGDFAVTAHPQLDIVVGASWSKVETQSEFRDWVDMDDLPIEQTTSLRVAPVTVSVKYFPLSRGERISELAWVPTRTTPYVGGGGGFAFYRLAQDGDFVEEEDLTIFTSTFISSGRAAIGHALAGVDHWFTPRLGANFEGRYTFGSATPSGDFASWDSIDLSGLQMSLGLALRW